MSKLLAAAMILTAINVATAHHFGAWLAAVVTDPTAAVLIITAKAILPLALLAWDYAEKKGARP